MTSSIGFAHSNRLDDATLSGGTWESAHPLAAMQGDYASLATVARSESAAAVDSTFDMAFDAPVTGRVFFIPAHNVTSAGTIRVRAGTTLGDDDAGDSGVLPAWPFTPLEGDFDGSHFGIFVVFPAEITAQYLRVNISDPTNPDGFIQISRPFWGPMFLPAISPTKLDDDWMPSFSVVERTQTGTPWIAEVPPKRAVGLSFDALTFPEASQLHEIVRTHNTARELVYVPHRSDRAAMQQYGFLALLRSLGAFRYAFWKHKGIAIGFDEYGGAPITNVYAPAPPPSPPAGDYFLDNFTDTNGTAIEAHTPNEAPSGFVWDVYSSPNATIESNQLDYGDALEENGYSGGVLKHPSGNTFTVALPYTVTLTGLHTEDVGEFFSLASIDGNGFDHKEDGNGWFTVFLQDGAAWARVVDTTGAFNVLMTLPASRDAQHTVELLVTATTVQLVVDGTPLTAEAIENPPVTFTTVDVYLGVPGDKVSSASIQPST
jgi:hypothetical protein